jgi:hypothetical protein
MDKTGFVTTWYILEDLKSAGLVGFLLAQSGVVKTTQSDQPLCRGGYLQLRDITCHRFAAYIRCVESRHRVAFLGSQHHEGSAG